MEKILNISTESCDLILDFFAGSGTTGDAVMQLNAEDGGNRKFILAQWDEEIDEKKNAPAHKFCTENQLQPVISSITIERLNRAGEKIKAEIEQQNQTLSAQDKKPPPDIGYKVYSLRAKPNLMHEGNTQLVLNNQRDTMLDTLTNMLCATCKTLDTRIECIVENKIYKADNEIYLLAAVSPEQLEPYKSHKINIDGWANIALQPFLNMRFGSQSIKDRITVIY